MNMRKVKKIHLSNHCIEISYKFERMKGHWDIYINLLLQYFYGLLQFVYSDALYTLTDDSTRPYFHFQAVLALTASWTPGNKGERSLTGTVIDSGDGVTHVIPVVSSTTSSNDPSRLWWHWLFYKICKFESPHSFHSSRKANITINSRTMFFIATP